MVLVLIVICGYGQTSVNGTGNDPVQEATNEQLRQYADKSKVLIADMESGKVAMDSIPSVLERNVKEVFKFTDEEFAKAEKEAAELSEITDKDGNVIKIKTDENASLEEEQNQFDQLMNAASDRMTPKFAGLMKEFSTNHDIALTIDQIVDDKEMANHEKLALVNLKVSIALVETNRKRVDKEIEELEQQLYEDGYFDE